MRAATIFFAVLVLVACLLRSSEAVTCTADATVPGCVDCTSGTNATTDAECIAEAEAAAAATTAAPTTAAPATTAATSVAETTVATVTGGNRKIVRLTNFRYTNTRRVRINRNTGTTATNRRNRQTNVRRVNVNNRRRNGNVRVIVG